MGEPNPTPENPYAAPQTPPLAELAPSGESGNLLPGELPCHRCGHAVSPSAKTCPHCGAKPLYDGLQLIVTGVLAAGVAIAVHVWLAFRKVELTSFAAFLPLAVAIGVTWPPVKYIFQKLKRGRW